MTTFEALRDAVIERSEELNEGNRTDAAFRGLEMGGECGEAQNVIKKLELIRRGFAGLVKFSEADLLDRLAEELADTVICADRCAVLYSIDLGAAVRHKFNVTSVQKDLRSMMRWD
jgi:hypothetical protein